MIGFCASRKGGKRKSCDRVFFPLFFGRRFGGGRREGERKGRETQGCSDNSRPARCVASQDSPHTHKLAHKHKCKAPSHRLSERDKSQTSTPPNRLCPRRPWRSSRRARRKERGQTKRPSTRSRCSCETRTRRGKVEKRCLTQQQRRQR